MTTLGWVAWALVIAGLAVTCWGVRANRRDWADLSADLDDSNRVVDGQAVLLSHIVDHLNDAPSGGKHAHTDGDTVNRQ